MANIEKRGKNKFRLSVVIGYDAKKRPIRERKTVTAKNITEAKKLYSQFETEIYSGEYIKVKERATLESFYNDWLEKYASVKYSAKTKENYSNDINLRILPVYGHMKLTDIETIHIVNLMNKLQKEGKRLDGKSGKLSSSTVMNCFKAFNSIMKCAEEWNYIKKNPAPPARPPKPKHKKSVVYNKQEVDLIIEKLNKQPSYQWRTLILLALSAAAREGEIAALEFKHIDFEKNTVRIEQALTSTTSNGLELGDSKTGNERTVSVPEQLIVMLKKMKTMRMEERMAIGDYQDPKWKDHFFIWAHENGKPYRPDSIYQWWSRFTTNNNIKRIRFHDLRHTSATLLINEGVHAKVISQRLGHAQIGTTMNIYGHVLEEADQSAAAHFDSLFEKKRNTSN